MCRRCLGKRKHVLHVPPDPASCYDAEDRFGTLAIFVDITCVSGKAWGG
jgi:hypothetical protein